MSINVSPRLLQAFLALQECRHFTRAAERCHVSQSAFSAMIRRLEQAVGAPLFDRDTRNVTLTPEGELFVDVARQLSADIDAAFSDMRDYVARRKGRVAIAALPSLAAEWLPPVIAEYRRRHPGITVALHDTLADECLHLLRQGKADIALTAPGPDLGEFETQTLYSDRFFVVCRRDHPLARRRRVRLAALAGCEMIHMARTTSVRQHLEAVLQNAGTRDTGLEVAHLATAAGLIASGLGISLVPELALWHFRHRGLVTIPVDERALVRPLLIVRRKGRRLSVAAQGMLELIEEKAQRNRRAGAPSNGPPMRKSAYPRTARAALALARQS
jgi:DNA-binding transcriptional LysR family regulator